MDTENNTSKSTRKRKISSLSKKPAGKNSKIQKSSPGTTRKLRPNKKRSYVDVDCNHPHLTFCKRQPEFSDLYKLNLPHLHAQIFSYLKLDEIFLFKIGNKKDEFIEKTVEKYIYRCLQVSGESKSSTYQDLVTDYGLYYGGREYTSPFIYEKQVLLDPYRVVLD